MYKYYWYETLLPKSVCEEICNILKQSDTELKEAELMENKLQTLGTIEAYIGTFFSKKWVQQNVLRLTDLEIEEMQTQINREAGIEPEDGGIAVPDGSDGITRYPSVDGAPIPADDVAKLSGNAPPEDDKEK